MVVGDPHDEAALALHQTGHSAPFIPIRTARSRDLRQASRRFNTIDALVPPKPKEFDRTESSWTSSLRSRRIGMSAKRGIELFDVGAFADEAVVHHQERIDRFLHAGGTERMAGQGLGRRDRRALARRTPRGSPRSP